MSYILEALKKSEQEQARGQAPDIHTTHDSPPRASPSRKLPGALITANVIIAVAIVAALLAGNFELTYSPSAPYSPSATSSPAPTSSADTPARPTAIEPPAADAVPIDRTAVRTALARAARELTFSTHIYASETSLRAVTIDGRRLSEGDRIDEELILRTITENGVVIEANGERYTVAVLNDWSR